MHTPIQTHDLCDTGAVLYQLHELSSQLDGEINPVLVSFSVVKIYDFIYTFVFFAIYWYITHLQSDQLPDGLISQLVEHWGWIPFRAEFNFFGVLFRNCSSCAHNCDDQNHVFTSFSAVQIYDLSYINLYWMKAIQFNSKCYTTRTCFFFQPNKLFVSHLQRDKK